MMLDKMADERTANENENRVQTLQHLRLCKMQIDKLFEVLELEIQVEQEEYFLNQQERINGFGKEINIMMINASSQNLNNSLNAEAKQSIKEFF